MNCRKCKKDIDENDQFCRFCGAKQGSGVRRALKRANGTGSVFKASGRRRKPWAAVVVQNRRRILLGYFEEKREALQALDKAQTQPIPSRYNATLEDVYNEWKQVHFIDLTKAGREGYETAWSRLEKYKHVKMREIRTEYFQDVISNATVTAKRKSPEDPDPPTRPLSKSGKEKIKQLCSQLCKKAMQDDIINKNYAEFVKIDAPPPKEKSIFLEREIEMLRNDDSDNTSQIILVLIYTGFRINELFELKIQDVHLQDNYFVGGEKTDAGKNRIVPIHPKIKPYVSAWLEQAQPGQELLLVNAAGNKISDDNFRKRNYYPKLEKLGIEKKNPHCTRHTFATMMRHAGVREEVLIDIIGHASFDNTQTYLHENLDDKLKAVSSI